MVDYKIIGDTMKMKFKSKLDEMIFIKCGRNVKLFMQHRKYNPIVIEEEKPKKKKRSKK